MKQIKQFLLYIGSLYIFIGIFLYNIIIDLNIMIYDNTINEPTRIRQVYFVD